MHFDDTQYHRFGQSAHPLPCWYGGHYYWDLLVALALSYIFVSSLFRYYFFFMSPVLPQSHISGILLPLVNPHHPSLNLKIS